MTPPSDARFARVAVVSFTALALAFLGYFEWNDGRPPTYDDASYLKTSLRMYSALSELRPLVFLYELGGALGGIKAPLVSMMPLPFFLLFGKTIDPTFFVNGLFLILSSFCLYRLTCRWYSPVAALLAVVVYQTFPITAGLARVYLTEFGLAALVLAFLYQLSISQDLRSGASNLALGVLLGLGLLMKILFPVFVAGPLLLALINRSGRSSADRPPPNGNPWRRAEAFAADHPIWTIGLVGGAIASSWYALNLVRVLAFAWSNAFGQIGDDYRAASLGPWLMTAAREGTSVYYALVLLVLAPGACFILWRRGELRWKKRHTMILAWILPAGLALLMARSNLVRFAAPILPVAAIAIARSLDVVAGAVCRQRWQQALLLTGALALPLFGFARLTFGGPALGRTLYDGTYDYHPPGQRGQWNQTRILDALRELTPAASPSYHVVVGVEHRYLNAGMLNYFGVRDGGPFVFMSLGYAQTSVEQALELIDSRKARFIMMADGFEDHELPAFLNWINDDVQTLLNDEKLPFRYRSTVRLTDRLAVRLYERAALLGP